MPTMTRPRPVAQPPGGAPRPLWAIAAAGATSLMVAMGIGRFAFTPLLPLMQREGLVGPDASALLAAANYMGYLLGALSAARLPGTLRDRALVALGATALLTVGAGLVDGLAPGLLLRLAAGITSAWTLVSVSSWAVPALAERGRPEAGGWVFAGVGAGIALAGTWVWAFAPQGASTLWLQLGGLAGALTLGVAWLWRPEAAAPGPTSGPPAPTPATPRADGGRPAGAAERRGVVLCYGVLGFGYILPATYLPALARALIDDPRRFGLVWPVFGLAAAMSTLLAARALRRWTRQQLWGFSHALMALGCLLPLASHAGPALALSALLVGGTFMVATMAGLQQARALAPAQPTPLLARMTAAFALGQIAGPLLALGLAWCWPALGNGIEATLLLAAVALAGSTAWLRRQPSPSPFPMESPR
jgi:MFS family permease